MSATNHLISVSIISHGDQEKIQQLLYSFYQHEDITKIQLILTENIKENLRDTEDLPWGNLKIISNQQPQGFAHNHNKAFKHSTGKYFCILNPDIIFTEPIFPYLIRRLKQNAAIISPLIVDAENNTQDSFRNFPTPLRLLKRKLPGYHFKPSRPDQEGLIYPDWIAGMFMFMRSETYKELGGFDEKFHLYFEDVDLCARARALGLLKQKSILPIVDTNLRIQHNAQRASRRKLRYSLWHFQSAIRFFRSQIYKDIKRNKAN